MKRKVTLSSVLIMALLSGVMFAQSPQNMSYQALIRNTSNTPVVNKPVGMRISIIQGTITGTTVYAETQKPNTNAKGVVNIEIGTGKASLGVFSTINWLTGPHFIKAETDPTGGTNYTNTVTNQILRIPAAVKLNPASSAGEAAQKEQIDSIKNKTFVRGDNKNTAYFIPDNADVYTSYNSYWNASIILPTPNKTNNSLLSRIGTSLLVRCKSTYGFFISKENSDLKENINILNGQTAMFVFDGERWVTIFYTQVD